MKLVPNKLKVSHFAQVPCKPFEAEVKDEVEAKRIIDILANQHLFLFENKIIPDYSNVICVSMWEEDSDGDGTPGWVDYWNEEESMEWAEFEETYLNPKAMDIKFIESHGFIGEDMQLVINDKTYHLQPGLKNDYKDHAIEILQKEYNIEMKKDDIHFQWDGSL